MAQFKEMHEQAFPGSEPAPGGFPDCGEGRYAEKLSYADRRQRLQSPSDA